MTEENLDKLVINYLTDEQYNQAKESNTLSENQLYMTPDNEEKDDSGWITPTLLHNWVNYDGQFQICRYRKKNGVVYIEGLVRGGTIKNSGTSDAAVFFLPEGFRPSKTLIFVVQTETSPSNESHAGRLDIYNDGGVQVCAGSSSYVSFNISFVVD